jgi:hypothetical protein
MQERRKIERRINQQTCIFPLLTNRGEVVESDRRVLPDRRLDNISVEEISCEDAIAEIAKLN